jgi:hypothetical protein
MKKNVKKNNYFIKRKKTETLIIHQHGILTQNFENLKDKPQKSERKKNKISTFQISTDIRHSDSKEAV